MGERFIAAATSAAVCSKPTISAYSRSGRSAAATRCRSNAATAASRRATRIDSSRWVDSITSSRQEGSAGNSNIRSIIRSPADNLQGVTRILQCRSGSARSPNAVPTSSRPTSPVMSGLTSMSPSASARSESPNSSGV